VPSRSQGQPPKLFITPQTNIVVAPSLGIFRGHQTRLMPTQQTWPASDAPQPPVIDQHHVSSIEREPLISNGRLTSNGWLACNRRVRCLPSLHVRCPTDIVQRALETGNRPTDASVEWASDAAPRLSSSRLATLLTPLTIDADV
jgi:hypothetical protein